MNRTLRRIAVIRTALLLAAVALGLAPVIAGTSFNGASLLGILCLMGAAFLAGLRSRIEREITERENRR